jgi:hypothetical protein
MRKLRTWTLVPVLGLALLTGCNGGDLDDPDGPNAVMEVETTTVPPARASLTNGVCSITVSNATSTLRNKAKSEPGTGTPFNDITVQKVTISYLWDDPGIVTPTRTFDLGATIPAGGTASVDYPPIALGDLTGAMVGHTATLEMLFTGTQVSGEVATADGGGTLSIGGACF